MLPQWLRSLRPRLLDSLREYSPKDFAADLGAGITVGVVALPLAMAFAIASGVRPEAGLITAIVAGFLVSALGGSRVQIGGPTGAFVVLVYSIVGTYGLANLLLCTMIAGVILMLMGLLRMGNLIKFIPYPVTAGFTTGIAVLIFSTQVPDFLGIASQEKAPGEFIGRVAYLARHVHDVDWHTTVLAAASLALIVLWPRRWSRYLPGPIVALVGATFAVVALQLDVATIGSTFGGIPASLPHVQFPRFEWSAVQDLIQPAITIAMLAAIESLLSAVVADGMIGDRHNSNQELVAQGVANFVSPLFGGIPATGAIARTATNIRNGARSPLAGIIHAVTLLAIMLAAAPLARHIPLAVLSAILMVVAWNMAEWHKLVHVPKLPKSDSIVLLIVFALTVLADLTVAVEVGMLIAAAMFIKRVADNTQVSLVDEFSETEGLHHSLHGKTVPEGVRVYRVFGAFLFGATECLDTLRDEGGNTKVLILRMRKVIAMDATGMDVLERLNEYLQAKDITLVLSGVHRQPMLVMQKTGFIEHIGEANICPNIDVALDRAWEVLLEKNRHRHAAAVAAAHA